MNYDNEFATLNRKLDLLYEALMDVKEIRDIEQQRFEISNKEVNLAVMQDELDEEKNKLDEIHYEYELRKEAFRNIGTTVDTGFEPSAVPIAYYEYDENGNENYNA